MNIITITESEFNRNKLDRKSNAQNLFKEARWFRNTHGNLIGTIVYNRIDDDWGYMILAKEEDGTYRPFDFRHSLAAEESDLLLKLNMSLLDSTDKIEEKFFKTDSSLDSSDKILISDINEEIKKYLNKNPAKVYELSPRKFEELIASILEDLGFDVELTKATRDGGTDIIAHIRTSVASFLMLVECKKYSPENKVDVGIIRQVAGVHSIRKPSKSLIVTTSTFTKDAFKEASLLKDNLELKDYNNLREWLKKY